MNPLVRLLVRSTLFSLAMLTMLSVSSNAEARRNFCGCWNLPKLCKQLGGKVRGFASHGTFCVIKKQAAHSVHSLSYRMTRYPQDCVMFGKKLRSNLGKLIRAKRLRCHVLPTCPVNKSFHVGFKCKCPKGTRFGAVSAAYRMCKTLVPPSCGVNRQFRAGTYCKCPAGTRMTRARHHLFRICRPAPGVKMCPVNKSFHVRFKCKCPKGTRFGAVSAAYRMCKTLVPPSCGVNRQFRAGTYCKCPAGTRMTRARHHLFRICRPAPRAGYCGCWNLRTLCGKVGGVARRFARYGLFCVVKNQSASYVHTLSYRMNSFPQDCAMFSKKLRSNLGKLIRAKRLRCR